MEKLKLQVKILSTLVGLFMIPFRPALAVTYEYIGNPLSAVSNSTLADHPIIFDFSTYNILPPDLTFDREGELPPASNVPVINWSLSVGQYRASGTDNLPFLQFSTDASGTITRWFFLVNPVTTDGKNQIAVLVGTELFASLLGPYLDFVQIDPGEILADFGKSTVEGKWLLLDPTPIPVPVPEPSTWAMLSVGFAALGIVSWRGRRRNLRHA